MIYLGVLDSSSAWPDIVSAVASIISIVVAFVSFKVAAAAKFISHMQLRVLLLQDRMKVYRDVQKFYFWVKEKNMTLGIVDGNEKEFLINEDDHNFLSDIRAAVFHQALVFGADFEARLVDWLSDSIRKLNKLSRLASKEYSGNRFVVGPEQIKYVEFRIECERLSESFLEEIKRKMAVEEIDTNHSLFSRCKKLIIRD